MYITVTSHVAGLSRTRIVSRSHRWHSHSQTKSKARDEPNVNRSKMFRQHLKCSLTAPRRAGTSFGFFLFLFTQPALSEPGKLGTALSGPASRRASAMTFSGCDTSPTVDCCSFSVNLSNAESRGTWKGWQTFAWIRMNCRAVVRRQWLFFFFFFKCLRGGEDSERGETKFSAGVTVTAPTTMHAEERQQSVPRDVQKCEQEDWAAVSGSERIAPYRLDQSRIEANTTGFSQTSIFIPTPFSGGTNGAQWRQGESKFLPCFS